MAATPPLTIGVDRYRKKEGLVQAHLQPPKRMQMVLGNITTSSAIGCLQSQGAEVCQDVLF
jgi:hypothetical protein